MPPSVSIVIPSWNGRHLLETFLPSVLAAATVYSNAAACEIILVDDGSTDGTDQWIHQRAGASRLPIRLIRSDTNLGFGAACNLGVRKAAHPLVFLLNNDIEVDRDAVAPLAARFEAGSEDLFAVHCRVLDFATGREVGTGKVGGFARGFLRVHRSYITRGPETGPLYSMFASGGSSMFDRQKFQALGGFDPVFAPFYFEDVELSYRAWKRGLTVGYEPRSVVRHQFSSTIQPLAGPAVPRIGQRNRLLFHWIHLHDRQLFTSHVLWVFLLLLSSPVKPHIAAGFVNALRQFTTVRARRDDERRLATRTEKELLSIFSKLALRPEIRAYDDPAELARDG